MTFKLKEVKKMSLKSSVELKIKYYEHLLNKIGKTNLQVASSRVGLEIVCLKQYDFHFEGWNLSPGLG